MSLRPLVETAERTDARADWLRLWQSVAGTRLTVPVADPGAEEIRPHVLSIAGIPSVQTFESMELFSESLAEPGACAEIEGADLAHMIAGSGHALAVHVPGRAEPVFLSVDVVEWIARTFRAEVHRSEAAGVRVSAPDLPPAETLELLGQTVGALGDDCPEAWLVAMTDDSGAPEPVLVLGLSDRVRSIEGEIAETVTRAVQAGLDMPISVACAERGSTLMARARECGIGIG